MATLQVLVLSKTGNFDRYQRWGVEVGGGEEVIDGESVSLDSDTHNISWNIQIWIGAFFEHRIEMMNAHKVAFVISIDSP